jgi:hypothetical protein
MMAKKNDEKWRKMVIDFSPFMVSIGPFKTLFLPVEMIVLKNCSLSAFTSDIHY